MTIPRLAQYDLSGLNVRVAGLELDVRDLKTGVAGISAEMRLNFNALSQAIADRAKTPWIAILSGASVVVIALGMVGSLALAPLQVDVQHLKLQTITRTESDWRDKVIDERQTEIARQTELKAAELRGQEKAEHEWVIKLMDMQREAATKLADVERAAINTSVERIFQHLESLEGKTTTSKP